MKWVRSYDSSLTTTLDSDHPFIYDPSLCEPYYPQDRGSYYSLFEQADDDIVLLEWDIAVSKNQRVAFNRYCAAAPDRVHVAPYEHYSIRSEFKDYNYVHRYSGAYTIDENDPYCFYFGFGMIYFPLAVMKEHLADIKAGFVVTTEFDERYQLGQPIQTAEQGWRDGSTLVNDVTFSWWYVTKYEQTPVPVHWDCKPVHLHYEFRSTLDAREDAT